MFFGDFWWFLLWSFYFIAYLYVVIVIITDLFRDEALNGWLKAVWIIARGKGMAARAQAARGGVVAESDDYHPSASSNPADDIAKAKALLDAGTISQGEFDALKSKALGNQYFGA